MTKKRLFKISGDGTITLPNGTSRKMPPKVQAIANERMILFQGDIVRMKKDPKNVPRKVRFIQENRIIVLSMMHCFCKECVTALHFDIECDKFIIMDPKLN